MINFASNLNKMINAGLGGPMDPPRTEVAVGHRVIYTEVSGDVVNFETNVAAPVKNLRVTMEPIQAGSGDPSPENIRPITGRDSVTVTRTGINVFDKSEVVDGVYINDADGEERQSADSKATGWISVVAGETYYILTEQTMGAWGAWYDKNKDFIGKIIGYLPSGSQKEQTAPSNAAYMRLTCYRSYSGNIDTFAVNHPSTDHDYHAYDGQFATIQLGQTVYGGTVDVTTGVLTVDREIVDLGTLNWSYSSNYSVFSTESLASVIASRKVVCSMYPRNPANASNSAVLNNGDKWITVNKGANTSEAFSIGSVFVKDLAYTDAASFKSAMSGVMLCYELVTPQTIQLTPAQLSTLAGENNVWSDAGDISLEFPYYEETEGY